MNILIDTAGKRKLLDKRQKELLKEGIEGEVKPWQPGSDGKMLYGLWIPEEHVDQEKRRQRRK